MAENVQDCMQLSSKYKWERWWWCDRFDKKESNEDNITLPNFISQRPKWKSSTLFIAYSVYEKCKSREVLTSLKKAGVSVGYKEVQRARNDLARFTYFQSKNEGVLITSHFSKDKFTIGAFDNFDHSDRSSLSLKLRNHGSVMTLFQVKPEQPPTKPDKTQIDLIKVTTKGKLPCQEKQPFFGSKRNIINLQKNKESINEKKTQDLENLRFIVDAIRSMFLDELNVYQLSSHTELSYSRHKHH